MMIITDDQIKEIRDILDISINDETELKDYLERFCNGMVKDYEDQIDDLKDSLKLIRDEMVDIKDKHNEIVEKNIKMVLNNYRDIFSDKTEMFEEMESFLYTQTRL